MNSMKRPSMSSCAKVAAAYRYFNEHWELVTVAGARLIDFMAEDGIVGQYNGSQAREVVISMAQWEAMKAGGDGAAVPKASPPKNLAAIASVATKAGTTKTTLHAPTPPPPPPQPN